MYKYQIGFVLTSLLFCASVHFVELSDKAITKLQLKEHHIPQVVAQLATDEDAEGSHRGGSRRDSAIDVF
ncbi:hypothetical protein [Phormidium sp. CCY1219]|uniref:hypothetical protein n=1 Tax=Phormidium sp. CCY1219 TaxID=2886104 RepID=UPI002D1F2E33|nr:hypothetical protein [Phormidium sp. CCY1219]MEB3828522.1 hypothetical protein [Phormidium sp. CCY1219]